MYVFFFICFKTTPASSKNVAKDAGVTNCHGLLRLFSSCRLLPRRRLGRGRVSVGVCLYSFYVGTELAQPFVDVLVAAVDLVDVVDYRGAVG